MKTLLLKNCNILDGSKEMTVQAGYDILIEGENIKKIAKNIDVTAQKTIDLKGAYVVPGLINLHVHLPASGKIGKKRNADLQNLVKFMISNAVCRRIGVGIGEKYAKMELYSGVTTLRAVGGIYNFDSRLAKMIDKGHVTGPRIIACDSAICTPHGHMEGTVSVAVNNEEEAKALVKTIIRRGSKMIKLMITGGVLDCKKRGHPGELKMDASLVKACCTTAHELGYKVAAHVEGEEGMIVAIENGVDSIEHGAPTDEKHLKMLKDRGGVVVCTLSPAMPLAKIDYNKLGYDEPAQYNTKVLLDGMIKNTNNCLKDGITVGLGTDTSCPFITHYDMWRELVYFTKYIDGVDNRFALYTATKVNAKIAGLEGMTGEVKENLCADLLIVKNNPLDNLEALRDPQLVIARGKVITKKNEKYPDIEEQLDAIL